MATDNWTDSNDSWTTAADWSAGVPTSTSNVVVSQGNPQVGAPISIASLTNSATLTFSDAGASGVSGAVTNSGAIHVDDNGGVNGPGGTTLTIGGTLTNSGNFSVGAGDLGAAVTVNVGAIANFINTTLGTISIAGNTGAATQAKLVDAAAAGVGATGQIVGAVNLGGHSLLQFASGQITTIAANSELQVWGQNAFVADAGATSSNSALVGLSTINGQLHLWGIKPLTLSGALTNTGYLDIDNNGGIDGPGGSQLTIGGLLTNSGIVGISTGNTQANTTVNATGVTNYVGTTFGTINVYGNTSASNGGPYQGTLDISSAAGFGAAGSVIGAVNIQGDALVEFASGQIATIAASSELSVWGPQARLADASDTSSLSALTGLTKISGSLHLWDTQALTLSGGLNNSGYLDVDNNGGIDGPGGTQLTISGTLINSGTVGVGTTNMGASTTVTAADLSNFSGSTLGTINISGNESTTVPVPVSSTLNIKSAAGFGAAGVLAGAVNIRGDANGHALLEFASGQITTIAANSSLSLWGQDAFLADASDTSSNSALTGLKTITGALHLWDSSPITLSAGLTNTGYLDVDNNGGIDGPGGASLTVTGTLTNSGTVGVGTTNMGASTIVTVGGLANSVGSTLGAINISGNEATTVPVPVSSTLHVNAAAGFGTSGVLTGTVNIRGDENGAGLLEFASGQITSIAASSSLSLWGPDAFIADASDTSSNSALKGLATINGQLHLWDVGAFTLNGGLTNNGYLDVDNNGGINGPGGTSLTVSGALVNGASATVGIGTSNMGDDATVTAASLSNSGTINLAGSSGVIVPFFGALDVTGAAVNNGTINVGSNAALTIGGALSGDGTVNLASGVTLSVGGGGGGGTISDLAGPEEIDVTSGSTLGDVIQGFAAGDTIDFETVTYSPTDYVTASRSGSVETVTINSSAGVALASFSVAGDYNATSFFLGDDASNHLVVNYATGHQLPTADDFNGDGYSDIVFGKVDNTFSILEAKGGTTTGGSIGGPGAAWSYVATGNFNDDAYADVLYVNASGTLADWTMNGTTVVGGGSIGNPGGTWSVVGVGDFYGEGDSDILFRNAAGVYSIWAVSGNSVTGGGAVGNPGAGWTYKGLGDFNGDGMSDILFENAAGTYAIWNLTGSSISSSAIIGGPGAGWVYKGTGDFDGDGSSDILFENANTGVYAIWDIRNDKLSGGGNVGAPGSSWALDAIGDYNGDGKSDLLFQNVATGAYAIWDLSNTSIIGSSSISNPGAAFSVVEAPPAARPELPATVVFQDGSGAIATWTTNGSAITGGANIGNPGSGWSGAGVGDFNGDGQVDILLENASGQLAIWETNGAKVTGGGTIGSPGGTWQFKAIGDFNGDGISDLLFQDAGGNYATWDINGTSIIGGGAIGNPGAGWTFAAAADFTGDGQSDLVFKNASGLYAIWDVCENKMVGGGNVGNPGSGYTLMGTGDFNGDGKADLLFKSGAGGYSIWELSGASLVGGGTIGNPGAGWAFAGIADLNGDHCADILFKSTSGNTYAAWDLHGNSVVGGGTLGSPGGTFHMVGLA